MGLADLHVHSIYSYDATSSIPAILKHAAEKTDLNVIALTDHDSVDGVLQAQRLAPRYGLEVVPGCEVSTAEGHLLTLFVTRAVPAGLSLEETVLRVGRMGGLCVAAHPQAWGTPGLSHAAIRRALSNPEVARTLVGVETFNSGLILPRSNHTAADLAQTLPVAHVGGSDSHILATLGTGATRFEGRTAADLRRALVARQTAAVNLGGLQGAPVLGAWLPFYLLRLLGWVMWNPDPCAPLQLARLDRALRPVLEPASGKVNC